MNSRVCDPRIVKNEKRLRALIAAWYVVRDAAIAEQIDAVRYNVPPTTARHHAERARALYQAFTVPAYRQRHGGAR